MSTKWQPFVQISDPIQNLDHLQPNLFWPLQIQTSPDFRSPLYIIFCLTTISLSIFKVWCSRFRMTVRTLNSRRFTDRRPKKVECVNIYPILNLQNYTNNLHILKIDTLHAKFQKSLFANMNSQFFSILHILGVLLRWPKKMTEFDCVRWPNSTAETCKMTKFARTVNLNWLSLTKIRV